MRDEPSNAYYVTFHVPGVPSSLPSVKISLGQRREAKENREEPRNKVLNRDEEATKKRGRRERESDGRFAVLMFQKNCQPSPHFRLNFLLIDPIAIHVGLKKGTHNGVDPRGIIDPEFPDVMMKIIHP